MAQKHISSFAFEGLLTCLHWLLSEQAVVQPNYSLEKSMSVFFFNMLPVFHKGWETWQMTVIPCSGCVCVHTRVISEWQISSGTRGGELAKVLILFRMQNGLLHLCPDALETNYFSFIKLFHQNKFFIVWLKCKKEMVEVLDISGLSCVSMCSKILNKI